MELFEAIKRDGFSLAGNVQGEGSWEQHFKKKLLGEDGRENGVSREHKDGIVTDAALLLN